MDLPQPLTPADCNLRGYRWMPLDVERVIDSDLFGISTGDEFKVAFRLWAKSWTQVPAASLPDDDRLLAHLAGLSENMAKWKRVRSVALRGWIKCSDERLYHPVIAEKALEAMGRRDVHVEREENQQSRQQRLRERRKAMFEQLREHGIVPAWDAKTSELERLIASLGSTQPVTGGVTPETESVTGRVPGDVTGDAPATAIEKDITGQDITKTKAAHTAVLPPAPDGGADALPEFPSSLSPEQKNAVPLVVKLRTLGVTITSANPLAAEWLAKGLTVDRADEAVEFARLKGKPSGPIHPNFLNALVDDILKPKAPPKPRDDWRRTNPGIERKASELGILCPPGKSHDWLRERCESEIRKREQGVAA